MDWYTWPLNQLHVQTPNTCIFPSVWRSVIWVDLCHAKVDDYYLNLGLHGKYWWPLKIMSSFHISIKKYIVSWMIVISAMYINVHVQGVIKKLVDWCNEINTYKFCREYKTTNVLSVVKI